MYYIIIKSGKMYWAGKDFLSGHVKAYKNTSEALSSLENWHFVESEYEKALPSKVEIRVVSEKQLEAISKQVKVTFS